MSKAIILFYQDLRISDNQCLKYAQDNNLSVIPLYIYDETIKPQIGAASKWWLHHALTDLNKSLNNLGTKLIIKKGKIPDVINQIIQNSDITHIIFFRSYEPHMHEILSEIEKIINKKLINLINFQGNILFEPHKVKNGKGDNFKVFTPFWKHCLRLPSPEFPADDVTKLKDASHEVNSLTINDLNLLPIKPNWAKNIEDFWDVSEESAQKNLIKFCEENLSNYKEGRDYPAQNHTSLISPYLHFGQISIRQVWYKIKDCTRNINNQSINHYLSELGWREFSYNLLYNYPNLNKMSFRKYFDSFEWKNNSKHLEAWQKGQTGFPIIDAAMRQLWSIGWMHNRTRMIAASLLTKNLMIDWRKGEEWFWDTLVDADLANNSASWQWVAGSGADAAPYFRVFNPVLQSEKFDPEGKYIKKWLPELKNLDAQYIHAPWQAPEHILKQADITIGKNYPKPLVDLKSTREEYIKRVKSVKLTD